MSLLQLCLDLVHVFELACSWEEPQAQSLLNLGPVTGTNRLEEPVTERQDTTCPRPHRTAHVVTLSNNIPVSRENGVMRGAPCGT